MNSPSLAQRCVAEFIGTFLLLFLGLGAVHIAVLTGALTGLFQVAFVWGLGVVAGVYVAGPKSGAHINPAITFGLAATRQFAWRDVPGYVLSQTAGAFAAAALVFALFTGLLDEKEQLWGVTRGGPGSEITAMCYGEFFPNPLAAVTGGGPNEAPDTPLTLDKFAEWQACLAEFIGTFILAAVVLASTDARWTIGRSGLAPVVIGATVAGLICVFAPLTQACFNPARDFGPRLFSYFAGWGEIALPGSTSTGWLTVYILSPIFGAIAGMATVRWLLPPGSEADEA